MRPQYWFFYENRITPNLNTFERIRSPKVLQEGRYGHDFEAPLYVIRKGKSFIKTFLEEVHINSDQTMFKDETHSSKKTRDTYLWHSMLDS